MNDNIEEEFESVSYEISKTVSKLHELKNRMEYLIDKAGLDGMFMCDFSEALERLGNVTSATVIYMLENKYRKTDIENHRNELKVLEEIENEQ